MIPAAQPTGDIKIYHVLPYGANTLVLFYKRFPASYSYTRPGKTDGITALAATIGSGSISATCTLE